MKLSLKTKKALEENGVVAAYFFGSRAFGLNHPHSDYDIGIVFKEAVLRDKEKLFKMRGDIYRSLVQDLPTPELETKLDISLLQTASPALGMAAIRDGVMLFESYPRRRADFEEKAMKRYLDYLPLKREYEEATFSAFS